MNREFNLSLDTVTNHKGTYNPSFRLLARCVAQTFYNCPFRTCEPITNKQADDILIAFARETHTPIDTVNAIWQEEMTFATNETLYMMYKRPPFGIDLCRVFKEQHRERLENEPRAMVRELVKEGYSWKMAIAEYYGVDHDG